MKNASLILFLLVLSLISTWYWSGVTSVPFHPDESTFLFLSSDLNTLLRQPMALVWESNPTSVDGTNALRSARYRYWLLDAPLGRYLVGMGRVLAGEPALPVDWDWGKSWAENQQSGALPSPRLLLAGRLAPAALFPLSVLLLFLTTRRVTNSFTAWVAALLMAGSSLVLLHTRRSVSEGPLLFTTSLMLWSLVKTEERPWLTAFAAALATAAKHTLAAFAPIGLLAVLLPQRSTAVATFSSRIRQVAFFTILFTAAIFLLNPFLWKEPVQAFEASITARQNLVQAQVSDRPGQELNTPARRLASLVGALYFSPIQTAEVRNYQAETLAQDTAYLSNPLHTLFRSSQAGVLLLIFNLVGFGFGCAAVRRAPARQRGLLLLLAAALVQTLALLALIPLPWQRYYLPLVPLNCFWTAYGLDTLRRAVVASGKALIFKQAPPIGTRG